MNTTTGEIRMMSETLLKELQAKGEPWVPMDEDKIREQIDKLIADPTVKRIAILKTRDGRTIQRIKAIR